MIIFRVFMKKSTKDFFFKSTCQVTILRCVLHLPHMYHWRMNRILKIYSQKNGISFFLTLLQSLYHDLEFRPNNQWLLTYNLLIEWLYDWMFEWLNNWMIEGLNGWMIEWLNGGMIEWLNDWIIEWLNDWVIGWLNA